MNEQKARRILLTGAAGGIGSAFFRSASEHYTFRLADKNAAPLKEGAKGEHEVIELDITDPEACQQACQDMDVVIHLAADPSPDADFYQSLLPNNIQGTYNIFRAAKDQGCQRIISASSIQVFMGYPDDFQAHWDTPFRPANMYGVSKCFGEAVATYFAHTEGLSSIAVRIGAYDKRSENSNQSSVYPDPRNLSGYVSARDLNHLLMCCIEVANIQHAVVHGISDNLFKCVDLTSTHALVGYEPQDDSFQIFRENLPLWLRL